MEEQDAKQLIAQAEKALNDSLGEAGSYLPKMLDALEKVSLGIQQDNRHEALELFQHCLEGLQWIYEIVQAVVSVPAIVGQQRVEDLLSQGRKLHSVFEQIVEALENADYVLMSDLLEYELSPALNEIFTIFDGIRNR